jgi:hypothetical protein
LIDIRPIWYIPKLIVQPERLGDDVIDKDTIIFWGTQKSIIAGLDILGRLMRGIVKNQVRNLKKASKRDLKLVTGIVALCYGTPGCGVSSCGVSPQLVNKLTLNNLIFYCKKRKAGPKSCLSF